MALDITYRAEVWQLPHKSPWGRIHPRLKYSHLACQIEKEDVGYGRVTFDGSDSALVNMILDTENDHGSLIRIFDDDENNIFTFWSEQIEQTFTEDGASRTVVHGQGIASILDKMVILPFSGLSGTDHVWAWGGHDQNMIRDGGFELDNFPNGGFEDGIANHWSTTAGAIQAIRDPATARSGDFYGLFNPSGAGSRVRRSIIGLRIGETFTLSGWIRDLNIAAGERVRVGVSGATAASHTNAYEDEEEKVWWAEIGNATEGNGATTTSYQQTTLVFVAGESQVEMFVEYVGTNDHNLALDDWGVSGANFEIGEWGIGSNVTMNVAEISTEQAHSGSSSLKLQGSQDVYVDAFGRKSYIGVRAYQSPINVTIGKIYTGEAWIYHTAATSQRFNIWTSRLNPVGPLAKTIHGGYLPAPGSYWMSGNEQVIPPNTWTRFRWTSIADTTELLFGIAWNGGKVDVGVQESPTFYIDDVVMHEGFPATTIGDIFRSLVDPIQLRGVGDWLDVSSITDALSSNGTAWHKDDEALSVPPGQTILQFLDACRDLGYEWGVVWDEGNSRFTVRLYNPGELGTDQTDNLTFHPREGWSPTAWQQSMPPHTALFSEGDIGVFAYAEDAALVAGYGKLEGTLGLSGVGITESQSLDAWIAGELNRVQTQRFAARIDMAAIRRFGADWNLGDRCNFAFNSTPFGELNERIHSVQITVDEAGNIRYAVDFVKAVLLEPLGGTTSAPTSYILNALLRKFRRNIEPRPSGFGGSGDEGGAPSVTLAASNTPEFSKRKADIECSGINDQDAFLIAASLIPEGGRILLLEGDYNISGNIEIDGAPYWVVGMGGSTRIMAEAGTVTMMTLGWERSGVRDLYFQGASIADVALHLQGNHARVENCWFSSVDTSINLEADYCMVSNCEELTSPSAPATFIKDSTIRVYTRIINNTCSGEINMGAGTDWIVANNTLTAPIISTGGSNFLIANNQWVGTGIAFGATAANGIIDLSNGQWATIIGNHVPDANGEGIYLDTMTGSVLVSGNVINEADTGIYATACPSLSVTGNIIRWAGQHGIHIDGSHDAFVSGNYVFQPSQNSDDTWDGIAIAADRVKCKDNVVKGGGFVTARYGVNVISGTGNIVVGNDLGAIADYGTDAFVDSGTSTVTTYPGHATYGDNFTT